MADDQMTKYVQKRFKGYSWPQLLVFKDKHSNTYYICNDLEAVGRAALTELKSRLGPYGYIQDPGTEDHIYGLKEELSLDKAEALPEPYRSDALGVIKKNKRLRDEWALSVKQYKDAKDAVRNKDWVTAYVILEERRDYEYEGFNFVAPIVP